MTTKNLTFHRHKCPAPRCAYVWRHSDKDPKSSEDFQRKHRCPKCGEKQTFKHWTSEKEKQKFLNYLLGGS